MKLLPIAIILSTLVISCTSSSPSYLSSPVVITPTVTINNKQLVITHTPVLVPFNNTPYNHKGEFTDILFIHFYGADREKIMNLIYSINYSYFVGVDSLDVVHTKFSDLAKAGTNNENAEYTFTYPGHGIIKWYVEDEDSVTARHNILHELSHHQCWVQGYKWVTIAESHQGCFPSMMLKLSNGQYTY